jgi:predicted metallopeptidase
MEWEIAPDIHQEIKSLVKKLGFVHIKSSRIFVFRSYGSKSRAQARIWSLPKIWQKALKQKPAYCLEVITEKFNHLCKENRQKVLIHELLHIPQNFSGALLSHRRKGRVLNQRLVEFFFKKLHP